MTHDDGIVALDVYHLWVAGSKLLPGVADQFRAARDELTRSAGYDEVFRRSPSIGGTFHGPAHAGWTRFREAMIDALTDSETNMTAAAEALCLAARELENTDVMNGRSIEDFTGDGSGGQY
ncbi:hypothetical protein [Actinoplanes regularis]|uniref:hypothetical protein n=1 Tax=Actinoplanes regularis TaxID=52697 RepID=UPI002552D261|nr:hypothetical protein [Actinoplanes regularis]